MRKDKKEDSVNINKSKLNALLLELKADRDTNNGKEKIKKRPLIVEFCGTPKAGKSTCIEAVKKLLTLNGFKVKVIHEKAKSCEINKFNPMFNFWTFTGFVNDLVTSLELNSDLNNEEKYDLILCDRGVIDALVWFNWQEKKGSISANELIMLTSLVLWDKIVKKIDQVIVFKSDPETALKREPCNILTDDTSSIMKDCILQELNKCIDKVIKIVQIDHNFIKEIQSVWGNEDQLKFDVAFSVLNRLKEHYNENIAYIEKCEIDFPLEQGILSAKKVEKLLHKQIQFKPRKEVEENNNYLQLIPIGVFTDNDEIMCVKKREIAVELEKGTSPELKKELFYVGGHVRIEDSGLTNMDTLINALKREITEEIGISKTLDGLHAPKGVYAVDQTKSKKHLGIYWIIPISDDRSGVKVDGAELIKNKGTSKSGKFISFQDLDESYNLETWSKMIMREEFSNKLKKQFIDIVLNGKLPIELHYDND